MIPPARLLKEPWRASPTPTPRDAIIVPIPAVSIPTYPKNAKKAKIFPPLRIIL